MLCRIMSHVMTKTTLLMGLIVVAQTLKQIFWLKRMIDYYLIEQYNQVIQKFRSVATQQQPLTGKFKGEK